MLKDIMLSNIPAMKPLIMTSTAKPNITANMVSPVRRRLRPKSR
jgi:hypothetical protein